MKPFLQKLTAGRDLTVDEARAAMDLIFSGQASQAQVGAFLAALRTKGETVEEIAGCARSMRAHCTPVATRHPVVVDTCGTGGDGAGTFNISTTAAFVVAACGLPVAKHGNRAASSRSGSADVLEALGVRIDLTPERVGDCLDEVGIGFLFAQRLHGAMRHAAAARSELGVRTVFNLLGPLTNPAGAQCQLIGVPEAGLTSVIASVLASLGTRHALVVHGDGLDEMTVTGPTLVAETDARGLRTYEVAPEDVGLKRAPREAILGGTPAENAEISLAVLGGARGPQRDIVCLNAGAALLAGDVARDLREGVAQAQAAIDSGAALRKLEELRACAAAFAAAEAATAAGGAAG
jgi:anthranilate phosphoribosyltransferase